jgi:hypothetical protein
MKLLEVSGTKQGMSERKINNVETNSKIKNS